MDVHPTSGHIAWLPNGQPHLARPSSSLSPVDSAASVTLGLSDGDFRRPIMVTLIGLSCAWAGFISGPLLAEEERRTLACPTLFLWRGGDAPEAEDDGPLVTDRPDFTEASSTVGAGTAQLEIGYLFVEDNSPTESFRAHAYPNALLRVGLLRDWLELRIGWTVIDERRRTSGVQTADVGAADLYLGTKLAMTPQQGWLPETALVLQTLVPTAGEDFGADELRPGINYIYAWDLTENWSVAGSTQANRWNQDDGDSYTLFAQSVTTGLSLTERLGCYCEWFSFFSHAATDPDVQTVHFLDGGFTFLLTDDLQYDVYSGVGLNDAADDYFLGTGLSIRF